jgi:hypothetical protein
MQPAAARGAYVVDSALQEVASRGDVTGSLERATTGRSDKKNFIYRTASGFSCR